MSSLIPEVSYGTVVGGDFMVERLLGRGSMGTLYVAEQLSTAHKRALKLLRREYVADATLFKRFEREAQMASKIRSEHVAHVVGSGVDRKLDRPWIAMELLEGQHLGSVIEERGALGPAEVRTIFEQLAHAVAAAHEVGIIHRDLKPANVFLGDTRRVGASRMVKVLDFGVARIASETLTPFGAPLGSPHWMAPEQLRGEPATPASDVWALGLIAFYALTGKRFWLAAHDPAATLLELRDEAIPIATTRAIELGVPTPFPPGFDQWFAQCVARAPDERFVTAAAAYVALAGVLPAGVP